MIIGVKPGVLRVKTWGFGNLLIPFIILVLLSAACQKSRRGQEFLLSCEIGADQGGTISGVWEVRPIPIAFRVTNSTISNWTTEEINAILQAARNWNTFFKASMGFPIFDIGGASNPYITTDPLLSNVCQGTMLSGGSFIKKMIIEKRNSNWSTAQKDVLAITDFCAPSGIMEYAQLRFNYQFFFNSNQSVPDLESLALHELGHIMGINHSCAGQQTNGFPLCADPGIDIGYIEAVMFPGVNFNGLVGELKRQLKNNDMGRTNCAYKG